MNITSDKHNTVIIIGSGRLYIDRFTAAGATTGERYVGDSSAFTLSTQTDFTQVFSGDGPVAVELENRPRQVTRSASITMRDMSMDNWLLWSGAANLSADDQAGTAVTDEEHKVKQGRWYPLGTSDSLLTLKPGADVVVKKGAATVTQPNNYEVDEGNGRIYITPGGAIADDAAIKVSYTPVARTIQRAVASATPTVVTGAIRYIEDTVPGGARRDIYIPNATIAPSGETAIKSRDTEQQFTFDIGIRPRKSDRVSIVISGVAQ